MTWVLNYRREGRTFFSRNQRQLKNFKECSRDTISHSLSSNFRVYARQKNSAKQIKICHKFWENENQKLSFPFFISWSMKNENIYTRELELFCWNFLSNTNFEIERSGGRSILYPWWCIRHNRWNLFKAQKHLGADSKVSLLKIRCC